MKWMVLLLAILAGVWLIKRHHRRQAQPPRPTPARRPKVTHATPMVACAHCGMHIPSDEAIAGHAGVYCGLPHKQAHEQPPPSA